jgi:Ti-type conjugative transfer relaxase TraA
MAHLYVASRRVLEGKRANVPIYHLSVKVVSRGKGQSVVASAAYRASEALHDERYGLTHDYTRKQGVEHSEILLPEGAPQWMADRQTLWNAVEQTEKRKDSQLARELEIGLPIELTHDENVALTRDYVQKHFVSKGMVADFSIHEDDPGNPHAHVLLTMREVTPEGFGAKVRSWNAKADLLQWREAWAEAANEHLAQAGHNVRIDHRTLEAQNIELEPSRKIGIGRERQEEKKLPRHIAERIKDAERVAHENGELILADPTIALRTMTHQRSTFTERDIAKFLHTRTHGAEQFQAAFLKVTTSEELVALGKDDRNIVRYTTRDMLEAEKSLLHRSKVLDGRRGHEVAAARQASALSQNALSLEQKTAFRHVTGEGDLKALVGVAGSGKSTLLSAARQAWEAEGLTVKGAALSGIAAENLEIASGIKSRTLASYEYTWKEGRDALTRNDVLVIDEAGMIGTKQLERMLAAADKAHAKVVLVGDPEQLQAIEAGAAFRGVVGQAGMMELTQVRRQKEAWSREATQNLATGRTLEAIKAYESHGAIVAGATREDAQRQLLAAWSKDRAVHPTESRLILAYTRDDVRELNREAREILKREGKLGRGEAVQTARGAREFAAGDRIMFLRNEKSLGVKNGSLGTVERIAGGALQVRLDGKDETRIAIETKDYEDLDYGYASTIHKSQGVTVDRSYVLASQYFDRHTSYVALSRHRESATLFYAQDEFTRRAGEGAPDAAEAKRNLEYTLSRARPKELAHDYLEPGVAAREQTAAEEGDNSPEGLQARARQAWAAARARDLQSAGNPEEIQRLARERWQQYRQGQAADQGQGDQEKAGATKTQDRSHGKDDDQSL